MEPARQVRGQALVDRIVDATERVLASRGLASLTMELVAREAGVNKTTLYRRWPGKEALVAEVARQRLAAVPRPDSADLVGDLCTILDFGAAYAATPVGRGVIRMRLLEGGTEQFRAAYRGVEPMFEDVLRNRLLDAARRGELPRDTDASGMAAALAGAVVMRQVILDHAPDLAANRSLVALVVAGAKSLAEGPGPE